MSDFDKIFADKLDEEGRFPRKEKNWQTLSGRLDAFESGLRGSTPRLRVWQAAAAVSLIAAGVLFGKVISMRHQNAELLEQVAQLQMVQPRQDGNENANSADIQRDPADSEIPGKTAATPTHFTAPANRKGIKNNNPAAAGNPVAPVRNDGRQEIAYDKPVPQQDVAGRPAPADSTVTASRANIPVRELPDSPTAVKEAARTSPAPLLPFQLSPVKSSVTPEKPPMPAVAVAQEPVKPVRHNASRFRVGVQAVAAFPRPRGEGISIPTGSGISAEYTLMPHLRVSASADWLHYSVNTDSFLPHFNFPDLPPPPGNPHHELTRVEGSQRNQQYSLGFGYTVPLRFWVRPTLHVYHTWVRTAPATFVFEFEEHGPGGGGPGGGGNHHPEYIVKKLDGKWFDNIWRLGVGLEHETPRWVFALSADYSQSPGTGDSIFDALILKGGVQYKFD